MGRGSIGLNDHLSDYLFASQPPEHPVLTTLRNLTGELPNGRMQISPEQGHFLALLIKLTGARKTLEIGTFTGYSALAVALALPSDGQIIACDVSEEWTSIARDHWRQAGVDGKIRLQIGPAKETLAQLEQDGAAGSFDFSFIDANKDDYDAYYEHSLRLIRPGGLIAFDNTLFGGRVADSAISDPNTDALRAINAKLADDERVDRVILPVGDGMTLARRRH